MGILRGLRRRLGFGRNEDRADAAAAALAKRLPLLVPGYVGELLAPGRGTVSACLRREDMAINTRDVVAVAALIREDRIWSLECGTPCEVLEAPSSLPAGGSRKDGPRWFVVSLVRLLSGEHEGEACWVGTEFIR